MVGNLSACKLLLTSLTCFSTDQFFALGTITTAGLSGKSITDEYSKLVYRVHPLPETMIDYVWDYGALNPEDEQTYIRQMVEDFQSTFDDHFKSLLVNLLVESQEYIRTVDNR